MKDIGFGLPQQDLALVTRIAEVDFRKSLIGLDKTYMAFKDEILAKPGVNADYINSKYDKSYTEKYSNQTNFVENSDGTMERLFAYMDEWEKTEYIRLRSKANSLKELKRQTAARPKVDTNRQKNDQERQMAMFEDIERRAIERMIVANPDRHARQYKEASIEQSGIMQDLGIVILSIQKTEENHTQQGQKQNQPIRVFSF